MSNNIEDQEEYNIIATKYKQFKEALGEEEAKVAFASAFFTERVQALARDLPSIVQEIIDKIESESNQ
ncbi:hypothetical protein [Planktothrix sp. FACHB-1365]|uniref:hypothetical protein n=1 Tax=Planktothrix sp. FACHB-1365 TaxID=2692855 RepID=UPI0016820744|nr:hypothetical protein [Planktothrix sp. FACHB-1365]MBD2484026.1 hypothetical protein [Planktothrix sp. FACHB-1365]